MNLMKLLVEVAGDTRPYDVSIEEVRAKARAFSRDAQASATAAVSGWSGQVGPAIQSIQGRFAALGGTVQATTAGLVGLGRSAADALAAIPRALDSARQGLAALGRDAAIQGAVLSAALTAPLVGLARQGLGFNALRESAEVAFTTMLHDAAAAKAMIADLTNFARTTPFELSSIFPRAQTLLTMGFSASEIIPTLTRIGNMVSAMGGGADLMQRITLSISQMRTQGRLTGEELRELALAGVNLVQALADRLGKTPAEIRAMIEKGDIDAQTALAALFAYVDKNFSGMMARQAETWNGVMSNITDYTTQLLSDVTLPAFVRIRDMLKGAMEAVDSLRMAFGRLSPDAKSAVLVFLSMAAAAGPALLVISGLSMAVGFLISPLGTATAAAVSLGAAWAGNVGGFRDWILESDGVIGRLRDMVTYGDNATRALQALTLAGAVYAGIMGINFAVATYSAMAGLVNLAWTIQKPVLAALDAMIARIAIALIPALAGLGLPIVAVISAVGALAVAWTTNMGNIQERTAEMAKNVGASLHDLVARMAQVPSVTQPLWAAADALGNWWESTHTPTPMAVPAHESIPRAIPAHNPNQTWIDEIKAMMAQIPRMTLPTGGIFDLGGDLIEQGRKLIEEWQRGFPDLKASLARLFAPDPKEVERLWREGERAMYQGTQQVAQSVAAAGKDGLRTLDSLLDAVKRKAADVKQHLSDLASTPITGTSYYASRITSLEDQIARQQLQRARAVAAGAREAALRPFDQEIQRLQNLLEVARSEQRVYLEPWQRAVQAAAQPPRAEMAPGELISALRARQNELAAWNAAAARLEAVQREIKGEIDISLDVNGNWNVTGTAPREITEAVGQAAMQAVQRFVAGLVATNPVPSAVTPGVIR